MEAVHTETYRGYTIKIYPDDPMESPRDWDNLGTMVCWHDRYNLGDVQVRSQSQFDEVMPPKDEVAVALSLYLYDHSGITMSTSPFSCPWDSGKIGLIYVTKETLRKEYGLKRVSKKAKERATQVLEGEVKTYDDFLTGSVYGFVCEAPNGEEWLWDSCWGFYGGWKSEGWDYMMSEAKDAIDERIKELEREERERIERAVRVHAETVKRWIKGNVPLIYRTPLMV